MRGEGGGEYTNKLTYDRGVYITEKQKPDLFLLAKLECEGGMDKERGKVNVRMQPPRHSG